VATTAGRPKLRYATVGWLLVVLAVGTVVLIRGATRYNPYLKNLRAATARVDKLRAVAPSLLDTVKTEIDTAAELGSPATIIVDDGSPTASAAVSLKTANDNPLYQQIRSTSSRT
jgi:hypothetical protein